jgi:DNA-binding NtrC family response regulator
MAHLLRLTRKLLWVGEDSVPLFPSPVSGQALYTLTSASSLEEAVAQLQADIFDMILLSVRQGDDLAVAFEELSSASTRTPIVVYAPGATLDQAVMWTKLGAHQVVQDHPKLWASIEEAGGSMDLRSLAAHISAPPQSEWRKMLIGDSPKIHNIAEIVRLVAPRRCTVLITGETGTGKEVAARAIHAASNRSRFEMVAVNCSALPENLLEAELFGHVKGAFTGAFTQRVGRFEQAHRGTLFLDEIGDMPLSLQAKLLRVLQERELQRLGSSETIRLDVRVIAATNANLPERIKKGEFREDLYYRLNVVPINMPAMRERPADIPALVQHFIEKVCREEGIPTKQTTDGVLERIAQQDWPGNVRQIENAVEMAIALSGERKLLLVSDFPLPPARPRLVCSGSPFFAVPDHGLDYERTVGSFELSILEQALRKTGGNKKLAADMLQLKRTTLAAKLKTLSEAGVAAIVQ